MWIHWLLYAVYDLVLCGLIIAKGIRSFQETVGTSLLRVLVRKVTSILQNNLTA
jgi:hypothetical protein